MKYVYVIAWSFVAGYSKERVACTTGYCGVYLDTPGVLLKCLFCSAG